MKEKLALIQLALRQHPEAAEELKKALLDDKADPIYDLQHMRQHSAASIAAINDFMQGYRIFCVSVHKHSEQMWCRYAENHKGVALRIKPNVEKDSKFQLFLPITYHERRPHLYNSVLDFIADGLFGDRERRSKAILDKIVYAKTLEWEYEGEYRLAIPLRIGEDEWNTDHFHPKEISELYLGLGMEKEFSEEVTYLARAVNPNVTIFRMQRHKDGKLASSRIRR